jgi:hypothetical protein
MRHIAKNLCHGIFLELGEHYRGHLPELARVNKAWEREYPGSSHQPMPYHFASFVTVALASLGEPRAAVGVMVAFDSFLRVSELLALTPEDVLLPGDGRGSAVSAEAGPGAVASHKNRGGAVCSYPGPGSMSLSPCALCFYSSGFQAFPFHTR